MSAASASNRVYRPRFGPVFMGIVIVPWAVVMAAFGIHCQSNPGACSEWRLDTYLGCAGLAAAVIIYFACTTYYVLEPRHLLVRVGFLHKVIPLADIESVEVRKLFGAFYAGINAAWDFKKVMIRYRDKGKQKVVYVAPKREEEFLTDMNERRAS